MMRHSTFIIAVIIVSVLLGMAFSMLLLVPKSAPVTLVDTGYTPGEHCPGDTVTYTVTWQVNRPVNLEVTKSHNRAGADAAVLGKEKRYINIDTPRRLTDTDARFIVPNLSPGNYERVVGISANSEGRRPAQLVQPYTIREDCEE